MAGRIRTTKKLAQRIDRDYFKRSFPIPYWRRVLSVVFTAAGLIWVSWSLLSGKQEAFNAGPLAHGHRIVTNNCQSCHHEPAAWGTKITDRACLTCHDGPVHQARQTFTPMCDDCHVDHRNSFRLAAVSDISCTQCHSDLKVTGGEHRYADHVRSLFDGHPEFAAVRSGHPPDPGTIKLNHQVHLKAGLKGPKGPVQMVCSDCHHQGLPAPRVQAASTNPDAGMVAAMNEYQRSLTPQMEPVNFERDCMSCHPLNFDARFKDPAPHKDAKTVQAYLIAQYTQYIAAHSNEVHEVTPLNPGLPVRPTQPAPRNAAEWVSQRVEEADRLLFQKDCKECHPLTYPAPASLPDVPRANQTVRWMKNAWFDHKAHLLVECTECHAQVRQSQKTEDVLLPKIATCQKCHTGAQTSAASGCYECHIYHDWSKAKPVKNTNTISQLLH